MHISHTLLAITVAVIWGVNFTAIKWGLDSLPPLMFTALRFFLTAFPVIFFIKRPPKISHTLIIYAMGTFVIQFGFVFLAMHLGASAGLTSLILQVQVCLTMIFAYFFLGEIITRWQLIGIGVSFTGLLFIVVNLGGDMPLLGFVCIMVAATGWSMGNIASKQLSGLSALTLVVWGGLISCIALGICSLLFETEAWTWKTLANVSIRSWGAVAFVVYVSTFIGFGLWMYLLQHNPASVVTPFALLVPIAGMSASAVLTGERMTWWKLVAAALIIAGLVVSRRKKK